jgi:hypothetical protein
MTAATAPTRSIAIPTGRRVTVVFHGSSGTFRRKTLKSMIDQTRWTEADLERLKLVS